MIHQKSTEVVRTLKYALRSVLSVLYGVWLMTLCIVSLLKARKTIACSDIFVMLDEGGFGHTITAPDIARRLFPGSQITILMLSGRGRHNFQTRSIWPDNVRLLFIPLEWRRPWIELVPKMTRRICEIFLRSTTKVYWGVTDLYCELQPWVSPDASKLSQELNIRWVTGYFRLMSATPTTPPPSLPDCVMSRIQRALKLSDAERIASIYLRQKSGSDISSASRSGSEFKVYLPAIRFLQHRGYLIFITGDVVVPSEYRHGSGAIIDRIYAKKAGVRPDEFQIFSVMRASICISESGGGAWLPMVLGKPHLCINAYPYFYAMRGAWMFPKRLKETHGQLVAPERLFSEFLYKHEVRPGYRLENNTKEELLQAVEEFDSHVNKLDSPRFDASDIRMGASWYPSANSAICKSWFGAYRVGRSVHSTVEAQRSPDRRDGL
jgi:putative glycosyltransferase (TIGR04372 family)